jgi:hypothetical protein
LTPAGSSFFGDSASPRKSNDGDFGSDSGMGWARGLRARRDGSGSHDVPIKAPQTTPF